MTFVSSSGDNWHSLAVEYGILGEFPGDDSLLRRIDACEKLYKDATDPTLEPLVALLDALHFSARLKVALKIIAPSPVRDKIMEALYDYCFEPSDEGDRQDDEVITVDEDFVWLAIPDHDLNISSTDSASTTMPDLPRALNGNRYHIFSILPTLIRLCPSGVHIGKRYLRSASTRFQTQIIKALLHLEGFNNAEVIQTYIRSANGMLRKEILCSCKTMGFRQPVLEALIDKGAVEFKSYGCYCSTKYVEQQLCSDESCKMRNWRAHGTLYLAFIRQKLEAYRDDTLQCGKVWQEMADSIIPSDLQTEHVLELMSMLDEFRPCQINPSLHEVSIKIHLKELSAAGKDVLRFVQVQRITIPPTFLGALPKKQRQAMALEAIANKDFTRFQELKEVVSVVNVLPLKETFDKATSDQLWRLLLKGDTCDPFLDYHCGAGLSGVLQSNELADSIDALHAWKRWHLRSVPTDATSETKPLEELWKLWLASYVYQTDHVEVAASRLKVAKNRDRPLAHSQITLYARYAHELINIYAPGIELAKQSGKVPLDDLVKCSSIVLNYLYGQVYVAKPPPVLTHFIQAMDDTVKFNLLPLISLKFDPTDKDSYVSDHKLTRFDKWMQRFVVSPNPTIQKKCFTALEQLISQASCDNVHIPLPNYGCHFAEVTDDSGTASFVYFDSDLHQHAINKGVTLLKLVMQNCVPLQINGWPIVKHHGFNEAIEDEAYIKFCCLVLTPDLRLLEDAEIISRACRYLEELQKRNYSIDSFANTANYLICVGLFSRVVESVSLHTASLLRPMGDFHSKETRDIVQAKTKGRDGADRAHGHVIWLCRATDTLSPDLIASALEFSCLKLKNEAGHHRAIVFQALSSDLIPRFINCTLMKRDLKAATAITESLCTLLRNDLDHRDSVSLRYFPKAAASVMEAVLLFSPEEQLVDIRSVWISFGIDVSWRLAKASGGDESLLMYSVPLLDGVVLPSSSWIGAKPFDLLFPHRKCPQELGILRQKFDIKMNVKDIDDLSTVFGPCQFIEMTDDALSAVWETRLCCAPLRMTSNYFPADKKAAFGLLRRLKTLYKACGVVWQESSILTDIFDTLFGTHMDQAPAYHYHYASELLETIISVNTKNAPPATSYFFEVDRLAVACDAVFRYTLIHDLKDASRKWYPMWFQMKVERGCRQWGLQNENDRTLPFIVENVTQAGRCNPPGSSSTRSEVENLVIEARTLRVVLKLAPSAICFEPIRELVLVKRPDVFCALLCNGGVDIVGVFCMTESISPDDLLYESITSSLVEKLPICGAQSYARISLVRSRDTCIGMWDRATAIQNYMECPSTQHFDVLNVLHDAVEEPILEALILSIFSLDSPWHVLASLLSVTELEKRRQGITASLLSHVAKHVYVDRVVGALSLLREPSRRQVLKVPLHKAIIRMLFQARTEAATELLKNEWENEKLHDDVRYMVIKLSLEAVANSEDGVEWEWSLLNKLAATKNLDEETIALLISPVADRVTINNFHKLAIVSESEDEDLSAIRNGLKASLKSPKASINRRQRFQALMTLLEENSSKDGLRRVTGLTKLSLSHLYLDSSSIDAEPLQELQQHMLTSLGTDTSADNWIREMGRMYGSGVESCVNALILRRHGGDHEQVSQKSWKEECASLPVATDARSFVLSVVDELLAAEEEEKVRRRQLLMALRGISETGEQVLCYIGDPEMKEKLLRLQENADLEQRVSRQCLQAIEDSHATPPPPPF